MAKYSTTHGPYVRYADGRISIRSADGEILALGNVTLCAEDDEIDGVIRTLGWRRTSTWKGTDIFGRPLAASVADVSKIR